MKDVFLVKNVIEDIKGEKVMETFYKKKLQNSSQTEFRTERVLGRKEKKLYFRCKGYENSFKSWIDGKDIVWEWAKFWWEGRSINGSS